MRFYTSLERLYKLTGISIRAMSLIYIHKARQIGGGACTEVKYTGSYKYIACNRITAIAAGETIECSESPLRFSFAVEFERIS